MSARIRNLQNWIVAHGIPLAVDGRWGLQTRNAVIEVFRNRWAPAATPWEINDIAVKYGFDRRAMMAVAYVESGASGWDDKGLLKCLWERHLLFRQVRITSNWKDVLGAFLSYGKMGGYTTDADGDGFNDSWEKLADATGLWGLDVAGKCASFGKFQILGLHWKVLGYKSVADFIWQLSRSEANHYEAFARFIKANRLHGALAKVDGNPENCRAFARAYNGPRYADGNYHGKIAAAWRG